MNHGGNNFSFFPVNDKRKLTVYFKITTQFIVIKFQKNIICTGFNWEFLQKMIPIFFEQKKQGQDEISLEINVTIVIIVFILIELMIQLNRNK